VLTSEIAKLRKKIKIDHTLAMELWETENAEARVLVLLIADPEKADISSSPQALERQTGPFPQLLFV
jgi:hypothetical protein